ncbi:hypothetical protein RSOL_023170 [Rhizoctonia solani AG-3 Rhs1AP]|uniref:DUF7587 domain-containing protein n=2 Tax=Rhizoctonia solani AG-3 TaxID=1086053 RepID=A0A074RMR0_9AGAM|nr:hypothetical protein RSOL_023170 [Rhizoctonia solani AG-3 Rhs1AP]KEP46003.1 hypothetical protein V565_224880 [Rhizoctonia solani 123E]
MLTNDPSLSEGHEARHSTGQSETIKIVFRVFDSKSFRGYSPGIGFSATWSEDETLVTYAELLEAHLDPDNRKIVTPWLSTTRSWLWAVWEMNRRYESRSAGNSTQRHNPDIQVAIIDLAACPSPTSEHASSPLFGRESVFRPISRRKEIDTSEEILIYRKIPAAAIVSVWKFEKLFGVLGLPRLFSFHMPARPNERISFREVREQLRVIISSPFERQTWKPTEEGERSTSVAMTFMKIGYSQLEQQISRMIEPIRRARSQAGRTRSADEHMSNLTSGVGVLSTREGSLSGSRVSKPPTNDDASSLGAFTSGETMAPLNDGADASQIKSTPLQESPDATYIILPTDGRAASQVPGVLMRELSHFAEQQNYYEPIIIQIARQKIEHFRAIALEFSRTVPVGVLDQLNIDQHDWATMRWFMMGSINAWLAPLERKLDGLENNNVSKQKLLAQFSWLSEEGKYLWRDITIDAEGS